MAKTAEAYCKAIDDFINDLITEERCYSIMGSDRFIFAETKPQGDPAPNSNLVTQNFSGRGSRF